MMMDKADTLQFVALQEVFERLVDGLKQRGVHGAPLQGKDYFWSMNTAEMFNLESTPNVDAVGSIHDELSELQKLMSDRERNVSPLELERFGNLLLAAAQILQE